MNLGDVVVLVSGGPQMTVQRVGKAAFGKQPVSCIWFVQGKKAEGVFDIRVLKRTASEANR